MEQFQREWADLSCVATSVLRMRLLRKLPWFTQTKVITLKTQLQIGDPQVAVGDYRWTIYQFKILLNGFHEWLQFNDITKPVYAL